MQPWWGYATALPVSSRSSRLPLSFLFSSTLAFCSLFSTLSLFLFFTSEDFFLFFIFSFPFYSWPLQLGNIGGGYQRPRLSPVLLLLLSLLGYYFVARFSDPSCPLIFFDRSGHSPSNGLLAWAASTTELQTGAYETHTSREERNGGDT